MRGNRLSTPPPTLNESAVGLGSLPRGPEPQSVLENSTFSELLKTLHPDDRIRGKQFELTCKWFLENDPKYQMLLEKVWLWDEWPGRWGPDGGIDLVAQTKDGKMWAIQAKCYDSERSLRRGGINSFLSESSHETFAYRLLISTTNRIGTNSIRNIHNQEKPVGTIVLTDLETADVRWPPSIEALIAGYTPAKVRYEPRPHQQEAIAACVAGFAAHDRGKLIHACGTGKTFTCRWIHDALGSQMTLVAVPSLALISQALNDWARASEKQFDPLVVCSDDTVAKGSDIEWTSDIGVEVTTDSEVIRKFLHHPRDKPAVVFSIPVTPAP